MYISMCFIPASKKVFPLGLKLNYYKEYFLSGMCEVRSIIHIDMDAFFASVEKLDNPDLEGKPVIVGGLGKRGVVATASYEARKFGVKSAIPISKARKLCPDGIYLSTRFERYQEISMKIREIFLSYTPKVEPISLDEAFLDVTKNVESFDLAIEKARKIKREIEEKVGLTCSVGVAPNKFLAKLASDLQKPSGFVVIRESKVEDVLKNLPVSKIWGVGKATEKKLNDMGIQTIGDLKEISRNRLKRVFGKQGENLYKLARGIDENPVEPYHPVKSISQEITFDEDLKDPEKIKALQVSLDTPTNSTGIIRNFAKKLFEEKVNKNRPIRLIGVGVSNITNAQEGQLYLFPETGNEGKFKKIDSILDQIRERFGRDIIRRGG
jgi:DNA polymerase-4